MNKKNTKLKNNPSKIMTTIQFINFFFGRGKNEAEKKVYHNSVEKISLR